jgi:hypothetical protein
MQIVEQYQSLTNEALLGLKNLIVSYYREFPGLHPHNVKIGIFPPIQRYPAVSVNPRSSTFINYLSGNRFYSSRDFELAFWVDQTTKNSDRVLYEYSRSFIELIRDREEFTISDKTQRKQSFTFEVGSIAVSPENLSAATGNQIKQGYRITIPISFTSKNKVMYTNVEPMREMRDDWHSEEEIALYLYKMLLSYKNTKLANVREFNRGNDAIPIGNGNSLIVRMDNSLLEHFQVSYDSANLALELDIWSRLEVKEEALLNNIQIAEEVVQLLMIDPYVGGYAIDSFWQQVMHSIDVIEDRAFFRSSVIFLVKINDLIKRKGV